MLVHDSGPRKLTHHVSGELREGDPRGLRKQLSESRLETRLSSKESSHRGPLCRPNASNGGISELGNNRTELEKVKLIKGRLTAKTDTKNRGGCGDRHSSHTPGWGVGRRHSMLEQRPQ